MTLTKEAAQGNAVTTRTQGQRFELLIALEWPQINLKTKTIHLYRSKTDNEMVFHMTDDAYEVLVRRSENKRHPLYVFPNRKGNGPRR